ncbi:hypothetical protein FRC00_009414 [Tulasnella sp. 408]|nr:hypothetical protein FRC00_009414 [Tulasnella sp. 408]
MIEETAIGLEGEGHSDEQPISLTGISAFEIESFLEAMEALFPNGGSKLTFDQWAAGLHLATMWGFDDIREKIIVKMDGTISKINPLDRIDVSLKCRVQKWLHPAYEALCKRDEGLSDDEAGRLGLQRSAAIWRIRELLLSYKVQNLVRDLAEGNRPGQKILGTRLPWQDQSLLYEKVSSQWTPMDVVRLIKGEEALKYQ